MEPKATSVHVCMCVCWGKGDVRNMESTFQNISLLANHGFHCYDLSSYSQVVL